MGEQEREVEHEEVTRGVTEQVPPSEVGAGSDNPASPAYDPDRDAAAPEGEAPEETVERRADEGVAEDAPGAE